MGLLNWLKKNTGPEGDYKEFEQVLAELDSEIRESELTLSETRLARKNARIAWWYYNVPLLMVMIAAYVVLSKGPWKRDPWSDYLWKCTPLVVYPIIIVLGAKIQNYYYRRKLSGQETHVEHLRKKQKLKVEELKKRTGYYVTKGLIERYDRNNTPIKSRPNGLPQMPNMGMNMNPNANANGEPQPFPPQQQQQHQQQQPNPLTNSPPRPPLQQQQQIPPQHPNDMIPHEDMNEQQFQQQHGIPPMLQEYSEHDGHAHANLPPPIYTHQPLAQQQPPQNFAPAPLLPPQPKKWYEKLLDSIVGEVEGPDSKFALICRHCFTHNGLAFKEEFFNMQFRCISCGMLNSKVRRSESLFDFVDGSGSGLASGAGSATEHASGVLGMAQHHEGHGFSSGDEMMAGSQVSRVKAGEVEQQHEQNQGQQEQEEEQELSKSGTRKRVSRRGVKKAAESDNEVVASSDEVLNGNASGGEETSSKRSSRSSGVRRRKK